MGDRDQHDRPYTYIPPHERQRDQHRVAPHDQYDRPRRATEVPDHGNARQHIARRDDAPYSSPRNTQQRSAYNKKPAYNRAAPKQAGITGFLEDYFGDKRTMIIVLVAVATVALLTVIVCLISCGACSGGEAPASPSTQPTAPADDTMRVTFPEGLTVLQMSERLEQNGICTAEEFLTVMNTVDFSPDYDFLPSFEKLQSSGRIYYLEGYLFPDTYDFFRDEGAEKAIRRFLRNFRTRVTAEMVDSAKDVGGFYNTAMSFDDVIILASIVEREISANPAEMSGVAAVFLNRIKLPNGTKSGSETGGYLQSDTTKFYPYTLATAPEGFVSEYYTYPSNNVKGLPKGPICCPSLAAITATLNPDHGQDAFFFYTDINGKVYYAVTYNEHKANYKFCQDNGLAG